MAKQRHVGPGTWNPGEDEIIHIENKEKVRTNSRSITMRTGTPDLYSPPRVVMCLFVSFLQELVYPSGLGSPDGPDTHNAEEKREGTFLEIFFEFSLSPLAQRISREPTGEIRNADPRDQQPSQPGVLLVVVAHPFAAQSAHLLLLLTSSELAYIKAS